jgi:hypothetical protein
MFKTSGAFYNFLFWKHILEKLLQHPDFSFDLHACQSPEIFGPKRKYTSSDLKQNLFSKKITGLK